MRASVSRHRIGLDGIWNGLRASYNTRCESRGKNNKSATKRQILRQASVNKVRRRMAVGLLGMGRCRIMCHVAPMKRCFGCKGGWAVHSLTEGLSITVSICVTSTARPLPAFLRLPPALPFLAVSSRITGIRSFTNFRYLRVCCDPPRPSGVPYLSKEWGFLHKSDRSAPQCSFNLNVVSAGLWVRTSL
jgi:hypothetical protein